MGRVLWKRLNQFTQSREKCFITQCFISGWKSFLTKENTLSLCFMFLYTKFEMWDLPTAKIKMDAIINENTSRYMYHICVVHGWEKAVTMEAFFWRGRCSPLSLCQISNYWYIIITIIIFIIIIVICYWQTGRFFELSAGFFYGNSCNSGTERGKIVPKVVN